MRFRDEKSQEKLLRGKTRQKLQRPVKENQAKESQAQERRTRHAKTSDGQVSRPKSTKSARSTLQVDHLQLGSRTSRQRHSLQAKSESPRIHTNVEEIRQRRSVERGQKLKAPASVRGKNTERPKYNERNLSRSRNNALNKAQNVRGVQNSAARRKTVAKSPTLLNKLGDKIIAILAFGYKYRRILSLLLVLILLAATTFFVVRYLRSTVDAVNNAATQPSPTAEFEPVACTADDVQLKLSNASRYAGQSVNFTIHYAYSGDGTPCYLPADKENLQVTVTSGDVEVWNSQQCGVGSDTLQLLFMPEVTHKQSYAWDGNIMSASCKVTGPSKPGTYRAKVTGVAGLTDEITFALEQAPAAPATSTTDGEN